MSLISPYSEMSHTVNLFQRFRGRLYMTTTSFLMLTSPDCTGWFFISTWRALSKHHTQLRKYNKLQGKRPSQWAQSLICAILICFDQVGVSSILMSLLEEKRGVFLHRRGPRLDKTSFGEKEELCFKEVHENSLQSIPSLREGMFVDWRQCGCWTHGTHSLGCRFVLIWSEKLVRANHVLDMT